MAYFGYGIYALGMITLSNNLIFYLFQIILGISAALFFVSSRAILMGFKLKNPNRSFAWFYSSPSYANAIAPAIGAVLIWKFSFIGVFVLSLILQICNAIFCFSQLNKKTDFLTEKITIEESNKNYSEAIKVVLQKDILIFVLISFLILILSGFSNTFFLIFLKDLGWSQNEILTFNSILSLVFLPISIWTIKGISKLSSKMNIIQGGQIIGLFSMILGGVTGFLNFYLGFFIMIGKSIGGLISSSGRSGLLTNKLIDFPEESAAIDTIFSPLSTAMGSLIGGLLIPVLGYSLIFIYGGLIIFLSGLFGKLAKNGNLI